MVGIYMRRGLLDYSDMNLILYSIGNNYIAFSYLIYVLYHVVKLMNAVKPDTVSEFVFSDYTAL